jgi:hypothetical protein
MRTATSFFVPLIAAGLLFLTGCPGETPQSTKSPTASATKGNAGEVHDHEPPHDHDHHHHHAEKGPHGGALVAIGQDDAHLEIVLDDDTGTLTAYVLDGQAEKPVPIKQKNLQLAITLEHDHEHGDDHDNDAGKKDELPEPFPLMLAAVSPAENGTASEFSGQSDELKGAHEFEAALTTITIGEKTPFKGVTFKYPEGNEHDHEH